jgi:hypothetical protein
MPYEPPACVPFQLMETVRCTTNTAHTEIDLYRNDHTSHTMCSETLQQSTVTCTSCALELDRVIFNELRPGSLEYLGSAAQVLCAETPEAQVGDACNVTGTEPCLPTRAQLNGDGTVSGQSYLACNVTSGQCEAAGAPDVPMYLQACDATTLSQYGIANAVGTAGPCLIAWNSSTQTAASGQTRECVGDWDCPEGALCDDQIAPLGTSARLAVCKPGPRGTLTPAMLSR